MPPQDEMQAAIGKGFILAGFLLVAVSMIILFYMSQTVYQILNDPEKVPVVKVLMEKIGDTDKGVYGNWDGKPYDLHLAEPLRYMMYILMGTMAMGIMVRVFIGVISAGTAMLKTGASLQSKEPDNPQQPPMM